MSPIPPRTYTVEITSALADDYLDWTSLKDIPAKWIKVIPGEDGTAEVWFSTSDNRPS
jgi:hypothetical protein